MVDSLKFKNLNLEQLNALYEVKSSEECKDMLEKFLKTGSRLDDPRVNIIIDFHFYNLTFCRENGFSPEKISTFCAIMKNLLDSDMKAVHRRCEHSFEELKKLILKHSISRPPRSESIFVMEDVKLIADYVTNSYYRHFSLYRAVLAKRAQLILEQKPLGHVELPKRPVSLTDGIEVTGEIDDVALTEEENELVQRAVQQRLASTLREYETTKLGLTQEMEAITKEEEKNDAEGPVEEEEVTE